MEKLVEEIRDFFPDFNLSVSDMKNPTVTFVRDFYSRVLIELEVDSDNVRKAQYDQMEYAQDIDLLPILNLISAINTAFPFLNINLFDMLQPSPKRNAMLMSKVMNFMQFCEARVAANNDSIRKFQEAKDIEAQLMEAVEVKAKELADLKLELESCFNGREDLKKEIESMEKESYETTKYNTVLKERVKSLEENLACINKEVDNLKSGISIVSHEIEELKSQIVVNPMEEKRELHVKLKHKDGVLEKKKELEEKLKEHKEAKENIELLLDKIEKRVVPILEELEVLRRSQEMGVSALKIKKQVEELQKKKELHMTELDAILKNKQVEESSLTKQVSVLEKEEELLHETLTEKNSEYTLKSKEQRKELKLLQGKLASVNRNILNLENDYNELRSKFFILSQAMQYKLKQITRGE